MRTAGIYGVAIYMTEANRYKPKPTLHRTYHVLGGLALKLNSIRHAFRGYRNARDFSPSRIQRAVEYDITAVNSWLQYLDEYLGHPADLTGKNILELGPGPDLGVGLILLSRGAGKYHAIDVNNLLGQTPEDFYHELFKCIERDIPDNSVVDELHEQLALIHSDKNARLNYVC